MCVANSVTDTEMRNPMTAPLLAGGKVGARALIVGRSEKLSANLIRRQDIVIVVRVLRVAWHKTVLKPFTLHYKVFVDSSIHPNKLTLFVTNRFCRFRRVTTTQTVKISVARITESVQSSLPGCDRHSLIIRGWLWPKVFCKNAVTISASGNRIILVVDSGENKLSVALASTIFLVTRQTSDIFLRVHQSFFYHRSRVEFALFDPLFTTTLRLHRFSQKDSLRYNEQVKRHIAFPPLAV